MVRSSRCVSIGANHTRTSTSPSFENRSHGASILFWATLASCHARTSRDRRPKLRPREAEALLWTVQFSRRRCSRGLCGDCAHWIPCRLFGQPECRCRLSPEPHRLLMFAEVPLLAVFSRLLDVRGSSNLAEHLVLAAYTSSMRVLFATLIVIPFWYVFRPSNPTAVALASLAIWALYFGFPASQFFSGRATLSWCRGFLTAVLASASMQGLITLVASLFLRPEA
jgi:hypothetical protein